VGRWTARCHPEVGEFHPKARGDDGHREADRAGASSHTGLTSSITVATDPDGGEDAGPPPTSSDGYPVEGTRSLNTPVLISVVLSTGKTKPHFGQLSPRTACSWLNS
jgi:hypothetical protein